MATAKKKTEEKKQTSEKTTSSNVKNRLTDAYSNVKPEVNTYSGEYGSGADLSVGGNRVGGVTTNTNGYGQNYYGAYVDNTGNPNRGAMDRSINTPLGSIDYGYDGDTSYAGYTSPIQKGSMEFANGGGMDYANYTPYPEKGMTAWARNVYEEGQPNTYILGADTGRDIDGYYDKEINTPLGTIGYGREGGSIYGSYTPTQNSLQARLLNALLRRRQY